MADDLPLDNLLCDRTASRHTTTAPWTSNTRRCSNKLVNFEKLPLEETPPETPQEGPAREKKVRYRREAFEMNPQAPVKHFEAKGGGRDEFGNRLFRSPELAYSDREREKVKAGLLMSPEGQQFAKEHPGILGKIEKGLLEFEAREKTEVEERRKQSDLRWEKNMAHWRKGLLGRISDNLQSIFTLSAAFFEKLLASSDKTLSIDEHTRISYLSAGAQSRVFLLDVDGARYVVKTKKTGSMVSGSSDISQPYMNEMLQTQTLERDLGERFDKEFSIVLPKFLFASGTISCVKFEAGREPTHDEETKLITSGFISAMTEYAGPKSEREPLWKNIIPDITVRQDGEEYFRRNNFVRRRDGKFVWVDIFKYVR